MLNNSSKMLFMMALISGTLLTISSNSWLSAWMGLEINLLSFIPLMIDTNNLMSNEAALKYFLVQAIASSILLFSIILSMLKLNFTFQMSFQYNYFIYMILSSLLLKSGAAPFHFWFPGVMEGLSWLNNLILMTWQKIAPMMLISYLVIDKIAFIIMMSIMIGSLGGLNQTSLRKIMAFSSINHLGWMLAAMMSNETLWMLYFMMYSFLSLVLVYFFNLFKLYHMNQMFNLFFNSKTIKYTLFMNLLSLGGLPPFIGFIPKWMVIQYLVMSNHLFMLAFMVLMTLVTLYFYLRMSYSAFMMNYYESNWPMSNKMNNFHMNIYLQMSFISLLGLPLISSLYFIF
uniref:NADH-ubiquinone oxidoreductase chain 2 n=1 Tax=Coenomyia ferruginea TaxID=124306 RepID=A0A7L8XU68_9DIPT|nr:NADH dehydrogenase subunit 2 [Coenomyia ferruginea]QOI08123.1 NADH dehydrogenase subunit 2 [Coenomyia ferruginea]UDF83756.1 NADH dehydrogenase subunit 2 [Coenomyia ferruginea]